MSSKKNGASGIARRLRGVDKSIRRPMWETTDAGPCLPLPRCLKWRLQDPAASVPTRPNIGQILSAGCTRAASD